MPRRKIIPYDPKLKAYARELRNNSTKSEIFLWLKLKGKQMRGYDFDRQKPLGHFIADFFCYDLMLVIELDGYTHQFEETIKKDKRKEDWLKAHGISVLRFDDEEVYYHMDHVLDTIERFIEDFERSSSRL